MSRRNRVLRWKPSTAGNPGRIAPSREVAVDRTIMAELGPLLHELLDAHADTVGLAAGLPDDLAWGAHLDYLRALQRKGKEVLANASLEVSA